MTSRLFTIEQKARQHEATRQHRGRVRDGLIHDRSERLLMRDSPVIDECAWAAGLFEGEGTITMSGAARPRLRVMISSTDHEIIDFFQSRWPGCLRTYQPKGNSRPATSWTLSSYDKIEGFLRDIQFYVRSGRVAEKLALALEEISDRFPARRNPDVQARSRSRKSAFLRLNHRGTAPQ